MSRGGPLWVMAGCVALAGGLVGLQIVARPGLVIPLVLQSVLLAGVTWILVRREPDPSGRRWLAGLLVAAVAVRGAVGLGIYGVLDPILFAPDTASYFAQGRSIAQYWAGVPGEPEILGHWQKGYAYLNAWGFRLLGDPTWFAVVLNGFASLWTAVLVYLMAVRCFDRGTARVASALTALFPSLVLWSVLNVRDPLTTLLVTALVYLGTLFYERPTLARLTLLTLGAVGLSTLRDYMAFLVLAGMVLGLMAALRPSRIVSTLVVGLGIVLAATFSLEQSGVFDREFLEFPFQQTALIRQSLQQDFFSGLAGSAFGVGVEIETAGDALRYLPVGLAYVLFAPFPWAISSMLQMVTLPEVLLWYALVPFLLVGLAGIARQRRLGSLLLVGVLILTVSSYALVEGNFGTAYRHRAQIMPLFFVFCGHGLATWWQRRRDRLGQRLARRAEARLEMLQAARTSD